MNFGFIVNVVVKYLEAHPEVIEKLIHALLDHFANQPAPAAK